MTRYFNFSACWGFIRIGSERTKNGALGEKIQSAINNLAFPSDGEILNITHWDREPSLTFQQAKSENSLQIHILR
jgi:hypothetical protein